MISNNLTMRHKILYISLIIFILIIISVILILVLSEAGKKNVSDQVVVKCHELDETECLEYNSCRPYYGSSQPMTNDIVFRGCSDFPLKDRLESKTEKFKCLSSGKVWNDDSLSYPGFCEK